LNEALDDQFVGKSFCSPYLTRAVIHPSYVIGPKTNVNGVNAVRRIAFGCRGCKRESAYNDTVTSYVRPVPSRSSRRRLFVNAINRREINVYGIHIHARRFLVS